MRTPPDVYSPGAGNNMKRFGMPVAVSAAALLILIQSPGMPDQSARPGLEPLRALPYSPSLDLTSMDTTADACVDFYQYVCGGWEKKNPIPADESSWSVYAKLARENEQFLWGILEEASDAGRARNTSEQKIGDYFRACMDEPAIEKLGAAPLKAGLKEISALKSKDELGKYLGLQQPALSRSRMLFDF